MQRLRDFGLCFFFSDSGGPIRFVAKLQLHTPRVFSGENCHCNWHDMPNSNLDLRPCPAQEDPLNLDNFDLDQLLPPVLPAGDNLWPELSCSPDSIIRSIEMELDRQQGLAPAAAAPPVQCMEGMEESVRYIQSLPPQSLAPFQQQVGPVPQPANHPPATQAFSTPRLPIMPGVSARPEEVPSVVPMPMAAIPGTFIQPWVPFWTACPLPFNPVSYPQVVLPPTAEVPMCPPSSNPLAKRIAEKKSMKESKDASPASPTSGKAAKHSRGPRSASDKKSHPLKAELSELRRCLASSETESSLLRAKLTSMEQELSRQRSRLMSNPNSPATPQTASTATPLTATSENIMSPVTPPPTPSGGSPPRRGSDIYNTASLYKSRTNTSVDAFNQKIDFAHVELRKTNPEKIEAEKREYYDAQAQWHQRHQMQHQLQQQQMAHLAPTAAFVRSAPLSIPTQPQPHHFHH